MTKKDKKVLEAWIKKNGACKFDIKNRDIILYDGGLFSIEKEKTMRSRVIGTKKLPSGGSQIIFSRKKYPSEDLFAVFWMQELDDTIRYFKSMKRVLNKLGFKTNRFSAQRKR